MEMTREQMLAEIAKLQASNAALATKLATKQRITLKVSEKGAMSLYGLGRFPITLYKSQWVALLGATKAIETFLADNGHLMATKD